jgi:hypothetical protein
VEYRQWKMGSGICSGIWGVEYGRWNIGGRIWGVEYGQWNIGGRIWGVSGIEGVIWALGGIKRGGDQHGQAG